jgi:hypothetical protein
MNNMDRSLDILLAEEDFEKFKNFQDKLELNINACANLKSQLNIYKHFNNQLFIINNLDNDLVIYVRNNLVYAPKCVVIKYIQVITESNFCFKDIPILFLKDNKTASGFLTSNRIIKLTSENITCNNEFRAV